MSEEDMMLELGIDLDRINRIIGANKTLIIKTTVPDTKPRIHLTHEMFDQIISLSS